MLQHADWILPAAEKAGIPIMFFAPDNLPKFGPIAERHPALPLIIDHMGLTVEIGKERRIAPAIDEAVKLAKYSERLDQAVFGAELLTGDLSVPRHDGAPEALLRRLRPAALLLGDRSDQLAGESDLSAAHRALHQGAELPLRGG